MTVFFCFVVTVLFFSMLSLLQNALLDKDVFKAVPKIAIAFIYLYEGIETCLVILLSILIIVKKFRERGISLDILKE